MYGSLDISTSGMIAQRTRLEVISANIANQNTPGFKRHYLEFEELLTQAVSRGTRDLGSVTPEVQVDEETVGGADGNNVNMEFEMNSMRQNRLLYDTYASILSSRFEVLRASIQDGR